MYKKRVAYKNLEIQNLVLKILSNQRIVKLRNILERSSSRSSLTLIRKECIYTGRKRGLVGDYKVSRLELKRLFLENRIAGLIKST